MTNKKTNQIHALRIALLIARHASEQKKDIDDGGTCNLDTPVLVLSNWSNEDIKKAFDFTGLIPHIYDHGKTVHIGGAVDGCGFRRTAMAEAFRDSLKESGYQAYVYYKID